MPQPTTIIAGDLPVSQVNILKHLVAVDIWKVRVWWFIGWVGKNTLWGVDTQQCSHVKRHLPDLGFLWRQVWWSIGHAASCYYFLNDGITSWYLPLVWNEKYVTNIHNSLPGRVPTVNFRSYIFPTVECSPSILFIHFQKSFVLRQITCCNWVV